MNLVYDRTQADVIEAARILTTMQAGEPLTADERDAYFAGLRGCYGISDWNRVEAAVAELSAALNDAGYANTTVPHTLTLGDIVTAEQWARYLANVQALADAYVTMADTPELPDASDRLSITGTNAIERILADLDTLIGWMKHSYRKCGTIQCGVNAAQLPKQR